MSKKDFQTWFSPTNWLPSLQQNLNAFYGTAHRAYQTVKKYVSDEPIVYSLAYVPPKAQLAIQHGDLYRQSIKKIYICNLKLNFVIEHFNLLSLNRF